ncbi:MAG: protein translocase subunit SecDF [Polaribacter sp.]|uniref:protein translocase subunit SecDF n=1 Tax=Polaribacter sp. TaxID=1920175 RepID=UPI003BB01178
MQNKGLIKLFAILFGLVSLYQLSFTFLGNKVEDEATVYAASKVTDNNAREKARLERRYLDSVANKDIINLGITSFTYNDVKDKEMNLGLDLKGGFSGVLQVSVKEVLKSLSNDSKNEAFNKALETADVRLRESNDTYLNLFFEEFEKIAGTTKLSDPSIFGTKALSEKIAFNEANATVKETLQEEINSSIGTAFEVLRSRIDKFGVTSPNIQRIGNSGRIQIELPGAKDTERVAKLITSKAELQFWEVHTNADVQNFFFAANEKVAELLKDDSVLETEKDTLKKDNIDDILGETVDSTKVQKNLFTYLLPNIAQNQQQLSSLVAQVKVTDTATVNNLLKKKEVQALLSADLKYTKFLWDYKPFDNKNIDADNAGQYIGLYAIKGNRTGKPTIEGDVILDASQVFDQLNKPEVSMTMNSSGTKQWAKMTGDNIGNFVAVVLDDYVYTAPSVNQAITGGRTSISGGSMTVAEAEDIATVLKAGKLPAAARIIEAEVVGPSLGQEAIDASFISFGLAILLVLAWMILYYGKAGIYANVALVVNILFIFGVLSSFNAVLTLPGIAGIILTIGMSVDANVIIFERIKEGLSFKKGLKQSVEEGFSIKGALSAIIDANITTLLTGIILYVFGTGPIKGFALTLMIGIATSLFTAVFITRLLIDSAVNKGANLTFNTSISKGWFSNINIAFIRKRKIAYIISGTIITIGIISIFSLGLKQGVDFKGGRSYTVRFDKAMNATEVASNLKEVFGSAPEVKTYGTDNQLKITTVYRIDEEGQEVDEEVQNALFTGLKPYIGNTTYANFKPGFEKAENSNGIMSYRKVDPTIADDIKTSALYAVFGSLIVVFLYILLRFRKVSFSIGAVVAVFHDVLIVLGVFSIAYSFMPFDMEIDQSFIAAILTVVGYSLNDTVIIFDRIREFTNERTGKHNELINDAINKTLGRTINTSLTTLLVMLAIFFFGGDSIKGFMFALIIGVIVGTYSSIFVATPIMYDTTKKEDRNK